MAAKGDQHAVSAWAEGNLSSNRRFTARYECRTKEGYAQCDVTSTRLCSTVMLRDEHSCVTRHVYELCFCFIEALAGKHTIQRVRLSEELQRSAHGTFITALGFAANNSAGVAFHAVPSQ